jgi:hypothetical protein
VNETNDLRHPICRGILDGVLPREHCRMTWYGPGTGGTCVAGEQPITAEDTEVEGLEHSGAPVSRGGEHRRN